MKLADVRAVGGLLDNRFGFGRQLWEYWMVTDAAKPVLGVEIVRFSSMKDGVNVGGVCGWHVLNYFVRLIVVIMPDKREGTNQLGRSFPAIAQRRQLLLQSGDCERALAWTWAEFRNLESSQGTMR